MGMSEPPNLLPELPTSSENERSESSPWSRLKQAHQSTPLWGWAGSFITLVATVVGSMWKDDRFLLIFAWPFSICAIWVFAGIWSKDKSSIRSIRILGSILSGLILLCLYLGAPTAEREDAVVQ